MSSRKVLHLARCLFNIYFFSSKNRLFKFLTVLKINTVKNNLGQYLRMDIMLGRHFKMVSSILIKFFSYLGYVWKEFERVRFWWNQRHYPFSTLFTLHQVCLSDIGCCKLSPFYIFYNSQIIYVYKHNAHLFVQWSQEKHFIIIEVILLY